jgi:two-component sensor histidine kinase
LAGETMRVHRSVRANATAPGQARDALVDVSCGVAPQTAHDLQLLVSELVTNAVKYAGLRDDETIDLDVRTRPDQAEVLVRYPEHVGFAPPVPLEPGHESGLGPVSR